jgi:hypothetical protein
MPHREFCCNDLPPKGLVFSMATIAVLLGLVALALGYELVPVNMDWLRAPRWMMVGAGFMCVFGGIAITLVALPGHRRDRAPQA